MLTEILILLALSVLSVAIFSRLNIPAVLGYLVVGLLAGGQAFGLIENSHAIEQIAEIGVVFLLFTIGLEVSIAKLVAMRKIVFGIGTIQVVISTVSTIAIGIWLGLSWQAAFAVGGALAMSSTAIVVKLLNEQYELHQPHGNIALGVLLFQDLAVVPFLVLIPIFAAPTADSLFFPIILSLAKATFAFAVIFATGQYLVRPAIRKVAAAHSRELFTLFILLVALLAAWLTYQMGLSLAMGAFLAGIMLAETEYQHHVENEIRPFRDVLMGLFFISVGSQFDWRVLINDPIDVAVLTLGLIIGKGGAIMIITKLAGFERGVAVRAGILLGQGSEFGFALLALALSTGLLELSLSQPIIAAIILSMAISPLLIRNGEALTRRYIPEYENRPDHPALTIDQSTDALENHVVICGFGRTGQNLSQFFNRLNIKYLALEVDADLVSKARAAGQNVYLADTNDAAILEQAGLKKARALVLSFTDEDTAENIVLNVRSINKDLPTIVRTRDDRPLERLLDCGADEVIPDTIESSMMLARHTLTALGEDKAVIDEMLDEARAGQYARIRAFFHSIADIGLDAPDRHQLHSIEMHPNYFAIGKEIASLQSLARVKLIALRRNQITSQDPVTETRLETADVLIIEGQPDDIQAVEIEIMSGL
ncbi:MAG: monovalent cation:proton antiporter-2 (CPA2) family protein [Pseudomonadota bacterium]